MISRGVASQFVQSWLQIFFFGKLQKLCLKYGKLQLYPQTFNGKH